MTRMASLFGQTRLTVFVATLSLVVLTSPGAGQAQTTSITPTTGVGDLGTSVSPPAGNVYDITGGTRPGGGANLFHSFGEFSVGTNNIANFLNDTAMPTTNILSRVTGGNPSNIFGTLQTTNFGAANLYLINPAGVIFGPTASLNVGGSFAATTADYLKMTDGKVFDATTPPPMLSIAPVSAFGFLPGNPATVPQIKVLGTVTIAEGQTLSLIGEDLLIQGGILNAPSGRINMASVGTVSGTQGEVVPGGTGVIPTLTTTGFSSLGPIALNNNGAVGSVIAVDVAGRSSGKNGGTIVIRGSQLVSEGSTMFNQSFGTTQAGNITIDVGSFRLSNGNIASRSESSGNGGNIDLTAENVVLEHGGIISTQAIGAGRGGNVTVTANQSTSITGEGVFKARISGLFSDSNGQGNAGKITLVTPSLNVNGGILRGDTFGSARGGDIVIETDNLMVTGPTIIETRTFGDGHGADIIVRSSNVILENGTEIRSDTQGSGVAGNITLNAGNLVLTNGTLVSAASTGSEDAGNITLTSKTDLLMRNSTVTTTAEQASGGNIKLTAPHIIRLVDSRLESSVLAGSKGGNIDIDPQLVVIQNSQILANATTGAGGNITIAASGAVLVDPNSRIDASAGPAGISGSVNINAPIQILSGALVPLNLAYSQAGLSGDRCAADPTGQFSSFVQAGRDGVPQVPGALSPSPLSFMETLTSGSLGSPTSNWAAARLGLDYVSVDDSTRYWLHSACRS